jgi:hypothetical protein
VSAVVAWSIVIGTVLVVALAAFTERASYRRLLLCVTATIMWALISFAFVGLLAFEHSNVDSRGSLDCPRDHDDSSYAPSRWSWMPPGEVCEYADGESGPSHGRIGFAIVSTVVLPATLFLWPRKQRITAFG